MLHTEYWSLELEERSTKANTLALALNSKLQRVRLIKFQVGILLGDGIAVNKKGLVTICYKPRTMNSERERLGVAAATEQYQCNATQHQNCQASNNRGE